MTAITSLSAAPAAYHQTYSAPAAYQQTYAAPAQYQQAYAAPAAYHQTYAAPAAYHGKWVNNSRKTVAVNIFSFCHRSTTLGLLGTS